MAPDPQDVGHQTIERTPSPLCRLDEIPDREGRGFTVSTPDGPRDIFIVRQGGRAYAYINSCPHAWTPLDGSPDRFVTFDKSRIVCATHGALFEIETGRCTAGPCEGDRLTPFPVTVVDGVVLGHHN